MALSPTVLKQEIITAMEALGLDPTYSTIGSNYIEAIAQAVVLVITRDAKANVTSGDSSGQWPII
jgi:hypothetical protein